MIDVSDSTNMRVHKKLEAKLKKISLMTGVPMVKLSGDLADKFQTPEPFEIKITGFGKKKK